METTRMTWLERLSSAAVAAVLVAIIAGIGWLSWRSVAPAPTAAAPAPRATPTPAPPPTTCYLWATGNNAVLEVTGVRAEQGCREWQQWSLKADPNRVLAWRETRPELSAPIGSPVRPEAIKETCRYTLGALTYSVTDTGGQTIGTGWCRELYARAVAAG